MGSLVEVPSLAASALSQESVQAILRGNVLSRWQTRPSNAFMVANLMVGLYFLVIWTAKWIFLGRMNAYELEKFREKMLDFFLTKLTFLLALSHIDQPRMSFWVGWFSAVGCVRVFVGLSKCRFKILSQSPQPSLGAQFRNVALLGLTMALNHLLGAFGYMLWPIRGAPGRGPELTLSLLGLLLLDPLINFVEAAELCIQYAVLLGDLWRARAAEARGRPFVSWDAQGVAIFHLGLATKLCTTALTLTQHVLLGLMAGVFRFHLAEMMVMLSIRGCVTRLIDTVKQLLQYRAMTKRVRSRFPDATHEDLARNGGDCAICLDSMVALPEGGNKRLPCGHCFHFSCLRKLFERNAPICPLCRAPVTSAGGKTNETGTRRRPHRGAPRGARGAADDEPPIPVPPPEAHRASRPSISREDSGLLMGASLATDEARLEMEPPEPENEASIWSPGPDWRPRPRKMGAHGSQPGPSRPLEAVGDAVAAGHVPPEDEDAGADVPADSHGDALGQLPHGNLAHRHHRQGEGTRRRRMGLGHKAAAAAGGGPGASRYDLRTRGGAARAAAAARAGAQGTESREGIVWGNVWEQASRSMARSLAADSDDEELVARLEAAAQSVGSEEEDSDDDGAVISPLMRG